MAGFVGRYEHSLDTKGRVILPAKFRGQFERGGYLTQNSEGCLALWTPGEFERQMEAMQEKSDSGRADRNRARIWASNSAEVEIDRQGRMPIPAHLRTFAQLDAEVLVHGAIDRVELWNPDGLGGAGSARGELALGRRGLAPRHNDDRPPDPDNEDKRNNKKKGHEQPQDPEHNDTQMQDALDHVQLLDRRAGRPLHPPPRWSSGSPPPSRPTGRGAADGPLVRTHSRAARRSGLAVRIRSPRRGGRRDRRRGRPLRSPAGGVPRPAHRRARPGPGRTGRSPGTAVVVRGPGHAPGRSRSPLWNPLLGRSGHGTAAGVLFDLGVSSPQLDWAERGFSFRRGRPARHADGPDQRADGRRPGQPPPRWTTWRRLFRENGEGRLSGRIARPS